MLLPIEVIREKLKYMRPGLVSKEANISLMTIHNLLNPNYKGNFNLSTIKKLTEFLSNKE